jgi:hypothetical protein
LPVDEQRKASHVETCRWRRLEALHPRRVPP